MTFSIDAQFLREEIGEGSIGEEYNDRVRSLILDCDDDDLDDTIDEILDDTSHLIHAALDELVRDVVKRRVCNASARLLATAEGDAYEHVVDCANDAGGSTTAVVEHLLAHRADHVDTPVCALATELKAEPHQLHPVELDGRLYWLQINHTERMYALYLRREADKDADDVA